MQFLFLSKEVRVGMTYYSQNANRCQSSIILSIFINLDLDENDKPPDREFVIVARLIQVRVLWVKIARNDTDASVLRI